ncbi:MAG: hypothetical protein ACQEXX_22820 [Bacillota bacterium]
MKRTETSGLLVLKDGSIVSENYYRGNRQCQRNLSMSVSKSFMSSLIGFALQDGKIKSVDEPVTNYLPQLRDSGL